MHFLLTNDDGYDAEGLTALYRAIDPSHRVSIVAPADQQSRTGHAPQLSGSISVRRLNHRVFGPAFVVDGGPADCVRLGMCDLLDGAVDVVVAGINQGANLGIAEAMVSGTLAAAREGAFCGARAIAVSQMYDHDVAVDWRRATRIAAELIRQLLDPSAPRVDLWSINMPALPPGDQPKGIAVVPLSKEPIPLDYQADRPGPPEMGETRTYAFKGLYGSRPVTPGTDVEAIYAGYVVVTPMTVDPTDRPVLVRAFTLDIPQD